MARVFQILVIAILSSLGTTTGTRAGEQAGLEIHFAGTGGFAASGDEHYLHKIFSDPTTSEMFERFISASASKLTARWSPDPDSDRSDADSALQVVLSDLASIESHLRIASSGDIVLALNLDGQPAEVWESSIRMVLESIGAREFETFSSGVASGWRTGIGDDAAQVHGLRIGTWLLLSHSQNKARPFGPVLERIVLAGSPASHPTDGTVLSGRVDLAWLAQSADLPTQLLGPLTEWPTIAFSVAPGDGHLKVDATISLGEPYEFRKPLWHYPIEHIDDPIISFAAIRGVGPWLEGISAVRGLGIEPPPDQMSAWSDVGPVVYLSHLAFPMNNATNTLGGIAEAIASDYGASLREHTMGEINWMPEQGKLIWQNLIPLLYPYAEALSETTGQFVRLGLFPLRIRGETTPPPAGLFAELDSEDGVIYYQWEVTEPRLLQWKAILNHFEPVRYSYLVSTGVRSPKFRTFKISDFWLGEMGRHLGNSVTKVIQTSPTELTVSRRAHIGLTALELVKASRWLELNGFLGDELPAASKTKKAPGASLPVPGLPVPPAPSTPTAP